MASVTFTPLGSHLGVVRTVVLTEGATAAAIFGVLLLPLAPIHSPARSWHRAQWHATRAERQ